MRTSEEAGDRRGPSRTRSTVALWSLAGLVALVLVVAAVAGAMRDPASLDPASPEAIVQAYVQAVLDGDHEEAAGYLSREDARRCRPSALREAYVAESLTVTLEDVEVDGTRATVRVRLREPAAPPPFGGTGRRSTQTFALVSEGGSWRLTDNPWPLYWCPEER